MELLKEDNEQLVTQYEREKQLRYLHHGHLFNFLKLNPGHFLTPSVCLFLYRFPPLFSLPPFFSSVISTESFSS